VHERDGYRCRLQLDGCTTRATTAHHTNGKAIGDDPAHLVAACAPCNGKSATNPARPRAAVLVGLVTTSQSGCCIRPAPGRLEDVSDKEAPEQERAFLADLGITDRTTGLARARASRELLLKAGSRVLGLSKDYTIGVMVFSGLLARAQGFHEGSVAAIEADNPYAAFSLLRAYAENAAGILYLKDHPTTLDQFWRPKTPPVPIGTITNYAKTRFGGFRPIYSELSEYAHPCSLSMLASHRITGEDSQTVKWRSAPSFHSDNDAKVACGWTVELATATAHLLVELAASWPSAHGPEPDEH
jgi:hypothetical protein